MTGPDASGLDGRVDRARGVYGISVAAELVGVDAQSLRLYERRALLEPARTDGGTRRYSSDDLDPLRRIVELLAAGAQPQRHISRSGPRSRQRPATQPTSRT